MLWIRRHIQFGLGRQFLSVLTVWNEKGGEDGIYTYPYTKAKKINEIKDNEKVHCGNVCVIEDCCLCLGYLTGSEVQAVEGLAITEKRPPRVLDTDDVVDGSYELLLAERELIGTFQLPWLLFSTYYTRTFFFSRRRSVSYASLRCIFCLALILVMFLVFIRLQRYIQFRSGLYVYIFNIALNLAIISTSL